MAPFWRKKTLQLWFGTRSMLKITMDWSEEYTSNLSMVISDCIFVDNISPDISSPFTDGQNSHMGNVSFQNLGYIVQGNIVL